MGTSQSSSGPGANVPLVPPWTPDPPSDDSEEPDDASNEGQSTQEQPQTLAPSSRFGTTRRSLSSFAQTGDAQYIRRGFGHYVHTGYGGVGSATHRSSGIAVTASALWVTLKGTDTSDSRTSEPSIDLAILQAESVDDVLDAIIEAIRPIDGTQDAELERLAICSTLSDLLTQFPDAELAHLDEDQRNFAIEHFTARCVFGRFQLDVGQIIQERAPSATAALARLQQAQDYVNQTVFACFRDIYRQGRSLDSGRVDLIVQEALRETYTVFSDYIR